MINGECISILDYGAVAEVGYDNTTAISTAILAAQASGKSLFIPASPVPFEHSGALVISGSATSRVRICGENSLIYYPAILTSSLKFTGSTGHAIEVNGSSVGDGSPVSFELSGVSYIGNTLCSGAVKITRGWYASILNNSFFGFNNAAGGVITFSASVLNPGAFSGTSIVKGNNFATSGTCVLLTGSTGGVVNAVTIENNIGIDQSYGVSSNFEADTENTLHIVIKGNHFEGSTNASVYSKNAAKNWVIHDNYFEPSLNNSAIIDINGSNNYGISIRNNAFSKELQSTGATLIYIQNASKVSVVDNVSNSGGLNDRYSCVLALCLNVEADILKCTNPLVPTSYPINLNSTIHFTGPVTDTWRVVPGSGAGQFVGISAGDGWPGGTVCTVEAEYNKTNKNVSFNFEATVTTKSAVAGNVLVGVFPLPNYGNKVIFPVQILNFSGTQPQPYYGVFPGGGVTTATIYDAAGNALNYQVAINVGTVIRANLSYLTRE